MAGTVFTRAVAWAILLSHFAVGFSYLSPLPSANCFGASVCWKSPPQHRGRPDVWMSGNSAEKKASLEPQVSPRRKTVPTRVMYDSEGDDAKSVGRVSVYSVGAGLDLDALKAHVFGVRSDAAAGEVSLMNADRAYGPTEEVLHVTNAPLLVSLDVQLSLLNERDGSDEQKREAAREARLQQVAMLTQDIFYFEYGVVVFWGLSSREESAALTELEPFLEEAVTPEELTTSFDTMTFKYDQTANPKRPVRFDRMLIRTLRVEEKLALSYAMSQSSKLFVFEYKVLQSLEKTRFLPKELAMKGEIRYNKKRLNKIIGQLFVEQTEVNLFSSILDSPDFLWDDDEFVPAYEYMRSYLEVEDRVQLLNSRLGVIRELLDVLTAQVADNNSTRLEWIVIWLISVDLLMSIAQNPLFAGKRIISALCVPTIILGYKNYKSIDKI